MGHTRRLQPTRLAAKLRQIRASLDLTQEGMVKCLAFTKAPLYPGHISEFEQGKREPSLPLLLEYARIVGVSTDVLIDDEADLPRKLSLKSGRKGVRNK